MMREKRQDVESGVGINCWNLRGFGRKARAQGKDALRVSDWNGLLQYWNVGRIREVSQLVRCRDQQWIPPKRKRTKRLQSGKGANVLLLGL
jgi:hypothetical protein